ncbi:rod shape-determining protein MreC [Oceanobacillus zhaokaii]|uniref:Cell shape-determining protein MreC n=1 Tax=Oceanobacillus zhaokaii TaxID=2052660 RepID=A0A345PHW2_9BACI|nr:rod shape-determining protein MreC [Oceanobacillus zhaokaii]AXI09592.1 rod shape-determining protein MreC [Oceanobacillus zhaokaii]
MPFLRNKKLFVFLIGFIILVILIGYSLNNRENPNTAQKFLNDIVGWGQNVIHTPVNFVTDIVANIQDFKNTYEENQILREQIAQHKGLVYQVQELEKENEQLRNNLDITETIRDYNPIQATVIARSPEQWLNEVTINRGEQHGIKPNMVVITAEGMVGKIKTANKFTSKVQLLSGFDEYNRISAMISREEDSNIHGMIEGFDKETNSLLFRIIEESDTDIKEGELIVSSGMGGVFPAGLEIGTVKEVVSDQYGLTRTALVEPAAEMYEVNQVIVLDRSIEGVEESETEGDE